MITNRSAPSSPVVPILVYEDVQRAVDWLTRAFGFEERLRAPGPRGGEITHAQLLAGRGDVIVGKAGGPFTASTAAVNQYVLVAVDDVRAHCERARRAGAEILQQPTDMPFGERQYTAKDHAGHWWTFTESIADVAPEDWGATTARR